MKQRHLHFVVPGDIDTPTGGYGYDRHIVAGLRARGWTVDVLSLPGTYPDIDAATVKDAASAFALLPDTATVLVDGLAYARLPQLMEKCSRKVRLAALIHHPLADEGYLPHPVADRFMTDEIEALRHAATVICTSRTTGVRLVRGFGVDRDRLHIAPPGTERKSLLTIDRKPANLLCVATIVPRKGHDVLIAALDKVRDLDWTARFVGPSRDPVWRRTLDEMIDKAQLSDRIVFTGPLSDLDTEYAQAGIFVLATHHEGYGMAYAEAMAAGLPIIGCAVGAVPEVVPADAGALVPANDPDAFAQALRTLLTDPRAYASAAKAAREAAERLPRWSDSVATIETALEEIAR